MKISPIPLLKKKNISDGDEVCSFYTIVPIDVESWPEITLNLHHLTQTISGIEWKSNSHVTLQGDLSEDNPKWEATSEYVKDKIDFFFTDASGNPEGDFDGYIYKFYLPQGNITDLEKVLSAIFHKNVELDLTIGPIFSEELDNDYTFAVVNDSSNGCLYILINGGETYVIYYNAMMDSYENFSVVSNKLKN